MNLANATKTNYLLVGLMIMQHKYNSRFYLMLSLLNFVVVVLLHVVKKNISL